MEQKPLVIRESIKLLADGKPLGVEHITGAMREVMNGDASPSQIGAFLTALSFTPLNSQVLHSSATTLLTFASECNLFQDVDNLEKTVLHDVLDIVGTGGDTVGTFNSSTAASIVVAACTGSLKVAKHGNRSASGRCGSADLIEAMGANLILNSDQICQVVNKLNYGFLFAQSFHPAMKQVGIIRKEIGIRTLFNVLGPLINPAKPNLMLLGVGVPELGPLYAEVFLLQHQQGNNPNARPARAMIVHSLDGLDEISPASVTRAWFVENGTITERELSPTTDFGLEMHSLQSIVGGSAQENAETFWKLLRGEGDTDPSLKPILDFVLLNASAGLYLGGVAKDFKEGVQIAHEAINSGKVLRLVRDYIEETNRFKTNP